MQADDIFVLGLLVLFFGAIITIAVRSRRTRATHAGDQLAEGGQTPAEAGAQSTQTGSPSRI